MNNREIIKQFCIDNKELLSDEEYNNFVVNNGETPFKTLLEWKQTLGLNSYVIKGELPVKIKLWRLMVKCAENAGKPIKYYKQECYLYKRSQIEQKE